MNTKTLQNQQIELNEEMSTTRPPAKVTLPVIKPEKQQVMSSQNETLQKLAEGISRIEVSEPTRPQAKPQRKSNPRSKPRSRAKPRVHKRPRRFFD